MDLEGVPEFHLKPLYFNYKNLQTEASLDCSDYQDAVNHTIDCLICNDHFYNGKEFRQHMILEHNIVVLDLKHIAHLRSYAVYWKKRFNEVPFNEICLPLTIGRQDGDNPYQGQMYLLNDAITEDRLLREKLKRKRLEAVLEQHERERNDVSFERMCLFCKKMFFENRINLFQHMAQDHNFSFGKPDNIVFVREFLNLLEDKLKNFQCLYCEAIFKDRVTLKEHMRKKFHKMPNPKNTEYDKFYLINYLELDKNWEALHAEDDTEIHESNDEKEELWGDWHDKEMGCFCLFCDHFSQISDELLQHMKSVHGFQLKEIKQVLKLTYYEQVKLINYIRRQTYQKVCFSCLRAFQTRAEFSSHLIATKHASFIPDSLMWDQPQYYFPTYENDNLLCVLCDDEDDAALLQSTPEASRHGDLSGDRLVLSDDVYVPLDSILWNESIRNQLS